MVRGVPVRSIRMEELLRQFTDGLLVFHNLDTLYKAGRDEEFRRVCRTADFAVIDGQILRVLIAALWQQRTQKVSGSDFLPALCLSRDPGRSPSVFLLGAGPGVAEAAMSSLNAKAGREVVVEAHSPSFALLEDPEESQRVADLVNRSGADTLAVGLGAPKQEIWMARNRHLMPGVRRFVAVGATLDFEGGRVQRAPGWVSSWGLEWLYRLSREPRRLWRRYLWEGPQVAMSIARHRVSRTN